MKLFCEPLRPTRIDRRTKRRKEPEGHPKLLVLKGLILNRIAETARIAFGIQAHTFDEIVERMPSVGSVGLVVFGGPARI